MAIVAKAPRLRHDTTRDDRLREEKILQRLAAHVPRGRNRDPPAADRPAAAAPPQSRSPAAAQAAAGRRPSPQAGGERLEPWRARAAGTAALASRSSGRRSGQRIAAEQLARRRAGNLRDRLPAVDAGPTPAFERLMLAFDDPAVKSLLVELDEEGRAKGSRRRPIPGLVEELLREHCNERRWRSERPAQNVALREGQLDDAARR